MGWIVFALASAGLILLSRRTLGDPRAHGFFRLIAFEAILALLVLNVPYWFRTPLAFTQIVSWVLLTASLVLVIHGFWLLRVVGQPSGSVENTTILVERGAYRYIRHPLYTSLLCLAWGTGLKRLSVPTVTLALVALAAVYATARVEERENLEKFGPAYADYMGRTRMFIPYLL